MSRTINNELGYSYSKSLLTEKLCPLDSQTKSVQEREFLSNVADQPFVYIIIGEKRSGKTTLCINILDNLIMEKAYYTRFFLVTPSAESDSKWGKYLEMAKDSNTYFNDIESQEKFKASIITITDICKQDIIAYKKLVKNALEYLKSLDYDISALLEYSDMLSKDLANDLNDFFDREQSLLDNFMEIYCNDKSEVDRERETAKKIEMEESKRKLMTRSTFNIDGESTSINPMDNPYTYNLDLMKANGYDKKFNNMKKDDKDDEDDEYAMSDDSTGKKSKKNDINIYTDMDAIRDDISSEEDSLPLFIVPNHLIILDDVMAFTGINRHNNPLTSLFTNSAHLRLSSIYMAQKVNGVLASAWTNHDAATIYPFSDTKEEQLLHDHISNNLFWRVYVELKKSKGCADNPISHPFVHLNRRGMYGGVDIYRLCDYVNDENKDLSAMKPSEIMSTFSKTKNPKPIKSIYPHINK